MKRTGLLAVGLIAALMVTGRVDAAPCWRAPVVGTVVDPFRAPACPWCAGNRGVEYRVGRNSRVVAAESGTVVFVGEVADTRYVVVELPGGWRHTYGRLSIARVVAGDVVVAGAEIARTTTEFLFGLRVGDEYADPAPYIGELVGRARLIPVDGSDSRPAPPAQARCRVAQTGR
ncbi:MAG TPA: M23 family metallopeptidase [Ilumatobacteraceae bacterium]|nr:M23 family metallopeptidase [Ilumatobacteraceae bacterium]